MAFKLPDHVMERLAAADREDHSRKVVFANLSDEDLAASARFWMQHCQAPQRYPAGEPVYDSTFWHVVVPEMLRRMDTDRDRRITELLHANNAEVERHREAEAEVRRLNGLLTRVHRQYVLSEGRK